ncbi:MAG: phosphoribosylanthranilate isomerase [Rudaea sp.]
MNRVRVKFCGITRVDDAHDAVRSGADAIGLVLTKKSRRFVDPECAAAIRKSVPPFVSVVALFSDDDADWVSAATHQVRPDFLQFHGNETRESCESFGIPYIKSIGMAAAGADAVIAQHPNAVAFLFDSHRPGENGGSGVTFDWNTLPTELHKPLILAGGLTCDNVALAIRAARPFAVDVSSGIEHSPGIKDAEKMRRFISEVQRASGDN